MMRSILRCVLYWVVFIGLLVVGGRLASLFPAPFSRLLYGVLGSAGAFLTTWAFLKYEKQSRAGIGLVWERGTIGRFFKGMLIGSLIFGFVLIILMLFSDYRLQKSNPAPGWQMLISWLTLIPLALMEDVAFRSYPFLKLNKAMGLRVSQVIVAVAFALYHVTNGWSWYVAFTGPFVWSFVFGLAAVWSRGIAVTVGIHFVLNVLQSLLGIKGGLSADALARAQHAGLAAQLVVLAGALLMTEYFIREKGERPISKKDPAWAYSADDHK
jgi:membrane protease YdiL (CAAX protease family)